MTRILFWIGLLVLVVLAVRSKLRAMAPRDGGADARPGARTQAGSDGRSGGGGDERGEGGESMACCAHCHVYFPASEAIRADGLAYCSPAHVRLPAARVDE